MKQYIKQEWFLRTELLPSEIPNLFSNSPLYKDEIFELIRNDKFSNIIGENFCIPLNYNIEKKDGSFRKISLLHPKTQLQFLDYIQKYEYLLINFEQKSNYNYRKVIKLNNFTFDERKVIANKRRKIEQEYGIEAETSYTSEELDLAYKKYFAYSYNSKLSNIMKSPNFKRNTLKFRYFLKLDIQNFFNSIYTHALTWAIVGNKNLGKSYKDRQYKSTFAVQTDFIQQKSNNNETNGILIGPEFNRIIADIILTKIDVEVEKNLFEKNIILEKDYKIIRFVDDYFIFSNSTKILESIEEEISKNLVEYNLYLNYSKKGIDEKPFLITDNSILELKTLLNIFNSDRKFNKNLFQQKIERKSKTFDEGIDSEKSNYKISVSQILLNRYVWNNLFDGITNIIVKEKSSKRRVVLYFLNSIKLDIFDLLFINNELFNDFDFYNYINTLYSAIENITNIFSLNVDSDTTNSYIAIMLKLTNKLSNIYELKKNNEFLEKELCSYILEIENKIFSSVLRIVKYNIKELTNCSDLIVFLKNFNQKLSSQLLCEILENNRNNYFVLCSVGYYVKDNNKKYKVVLDYLFQIIYKNLSEYPKSCKLKLNDANYFYQLNDFIHYRPFIEIKDKKKSGIDKLKELADKELKTLHENSEYKLFLLLMEKSYYDWDTTGIDFGRKIINKKIINRSNPSSGGYNF